MGRSGRLRVRLSEVAQTAAHPSPCLMLSPCESISPVAFAPSRLTWPAPMLELVKTCERLRRVHQDHLNLSASASGWPARAGQPRPR